MRFKSPLFYRSLGSLLFFTSVFFCFPSSFAMQQNLIAKDMGEGNSFRLQPGNRLKIVVYREEDLSGDYEIDPAGKLTFPLIGQTEAAGLEIEKFRTQLIESLKKYLINPQISISRSEGTIKSISILGNVAKPGIYDYTPGSTLIRLISTAGGFSDSANKKKIKIMRMVNGEKKVVMVNGLEIINGEKDDPGIEPGDIIFVPESVF